MINALSPLNTSNKSEHWINKYYSDIDYGSAVYVRSIGTVFEKKDKWINTKLTPEEFLLSLQDKDKDMIEKLIGGNIYDFCDTKKLSQ